MNPKEIDTILAQAVQDADVSAGMDAYAGERVKERVLESLRPVRPLPSAWVFVAGFLVVFGMVAAVSGAVAGMHGWQALSMLERVTIFAVVIAGACFAAIACSREMRPASGRRLSGVAFGLAIAALLVTFALLFDNYSMQKFVRQGVPCLEAGLLFAVPAVLLGVLLLRRGFAVNMTAAGIAVGTLAGLAGIGGLELHCPNLKATHVMVWHVGVVVLSGLIVGLVGRMWRR